MLIKSYIFSKVILQGLFLLPILYFFYNTDFFKIYVSFSNYIFAKRFIDNIVLLATNSNIILNYKMQK